MAHAVSSVTSATLVWRVILALLLILVSYLALTPAPPPGLDLGWDKLNHTAAFAALGLAACLSLAGWGRQRWLPLSGLLVYGGAIEIGQLFVPGRSCEWSDLLADAIGITLGAIIAALARRISTVDRRSC